MKTLNKYFTTGIAVALLVSSCQKDPIDPPVDNSVKALDVMIQATNTSFSLLKSASALTPAFVWDSSYIIVSKIEFEAEKKDAMSQSFSEIHYEWEGPQMVDLFRLNDVVGTISLPTGVYHEISLKLTAYKSDAGNSPVFYLSGNYTNTAGSVIPVELQVNEDIEFRAKQEGNLLDASVDYTSLVHINLSLLLADVTAADMDGATLTDGKIVISEVSNTAILDKILDNLSTCSESHLSEGGSDDHGSNSGNDSGSDVGDDHGSNSGNDSGSDVGDDHGSNSGNDSGSDVGDDHGSNSGNDSGSDTGDDNGSGY